MATIAETKKQVSAMADEAVELAAKIHELYRDAEIDTKADELEEIAINNATEAEEAEKKADVENAKKKAEEAINELKAILDSENKNIDDTEKTTKEDCITEPEEVEAENNVEEEVKNYIYVGPSLKQFDIKENTIYRGTKADVYEHLSTAINAKPLIKKFIVEAAEAAEAKTKVKTNGNSLYKMYEELKK